MLLVACANVGTLLLARATARRHEMSVLVALGASRWQLVRQLATESVMIAAAGALLGGVLAIRGSRTIVSQFATIQLEVPFDARILGFTAAVATIAAGIFGIAPALAATGVAPNEALKRQARSVAGGKHATIGDGLVAVQVAVTLVLVFVAGLFLSTFRALTYQHVGFDRERVLIVRIESARDSADPLKRLALYDRFREAAAGIPGVAAASVAAMTPINGMQWQFLLDLPEGPPLPEEDRIVSANLVSPGFFATLGTRLLSGRDFGTRDGRDAPGVAIVNEAFVARYLTGVSPIGRRIRQAAFPGRPAVTREIVGVVEDAAYRTMRVVNSPAIYLPIGQRPQPPPVVTLAARTAGPPPGALMEPVLAGIARVDPDAAVSPALLADEIRASLSQERLVALLSLTFGGFALLLAGLGLYGVTSHAVTRRRAEIGLRMALGAAAGSVVRLVLWRVAALVLVGLGAGVAIAVWTARLVAGLLYDVEPHDPVPLGGAALALLAIAASASWLPARRASRIDPARVLRDA